MKCKLCDSVFNPYISWSLLLSMDPIFTPILCPRCLKKFKVLDVTKVCPICCGSMPCLECQRWLKEGSFKHYAYYEYNDWAKEWLNRYKIQGDYQLKDSFNQMLYHILKGYQRQKYLFVPIPLDVNKYHQRGFNQVNALLDSCHLSYELILSKKSTGVAQGLKNREERLKTPQPFECTTKKHYKKILIIDDIYTTGRTIAHAYQCLRPFADEIESFSLFRAHII